MSIKPIKKISFLLCPLVLSACGNLSTITAEGTTDKPVWPKPNEVTFDNQKGTFPNLASLKKVKPGMTKDQLYYLLGRPHFNEGLWGVREWDYLFHFHTPGQGKDNISTCQFKVLYDNKLYTRSLFWKPVEPIDGHCPPTENANKHKRYTLGADALFSFAQSHSEAITENGKQQIQQLTEQLKTHQVLNSITIYGHTDHLGAEAYNQKLSEQRANTVRSLLIQKGIPAHLIRAQGLGETQAIIQCSETNRSALIVCLAPNRRVEIIVDSSMNE